MEEQLIDFDVIEAQKENIQSIPSGRSAKALASLYSPSPLQQQPTPSSTSNINNAARKQFEAELENIAEHDDPLDIFERYVKWTMDAYPSAQSTSESQLLPLLERATKSFISSAQYKNDPRYLKLWLSYIHLFSDSPRETFAYLSRHNIGESLALFYEEFAAWLEGAGRWTQAEEVYNMGIQRDARPSARLIRKYNEFQQRRAQIPETTNEPSSPALPTVRQALAQKVDPFVSSSSPDPQAQPARPATGSRSTKSKLQIFSDASDAPPPSVMGSEGGKGWESIGSLAERRKENIIEPKAWVGETLKAGGKKSSAPKMAVFKDQRFNAPSIVPQKEQVIMNPKSGRHERIFVNLEAVYPTPNDLGTELSFEELRAFNRGWLNKKWSPEKTVKAEQSPIVAKAAKLEVFREEEPPAKLQVFREDDLPKPATSNKLQVFLDPEDTELSERLDEKLAIAPVDENGAIKIMLDENGNVMKDNSKAKQRKMKTMEVNETQIIKTKLSSPSGKKLKRKASAEPTMTFHTKAATDEIYDLFNQPLKSDALDEESEASEDDDDDDETDGEYTSGGESTGTGRLLGTSEAGDDETSDVKSVSEWSDFTARKHIPDLDDETEDDTRATHLTENDTRGTEATEDEAEDSEDQVDALPAIDTDIETSPEPIITPVSPGQPMEVRTSFVPIPPEDYVAPTRPYRNAEQISQNRLPFMTPIAEKTESSLGASTCGKEKDYFNSKTPSKENGKRMSIRQTEELLSSPFQEIINESQPRKKIAQPALTRPAKPATISNPIVKEATKGPIIKDAQCNPVDDYTRNQILEALQPPLTSYEGYFDHREETMNKAPEIRKYCKAVAKMNKGGDKTQTINTPPVLKFNGTDAQYMVKRELGAGAFAPVYLVETVSPSTTSSQEDEEFILVPKSSQSLSALKMEDPPTPWEFHITRLAKRRLGVHRAAESVINIHSFHLYKDECYLIEEYRDQGTLLDLVNLARADSTQPGGVMDEVIVMFFAIELFRTVEALHSKSILHGDLKADNCLVRFDKLNDDAVWSSRYCKSGSSGWDKKGISLIDFGRGIDMKAFKEGVQFIADWAVGPQDCAEMRELRPWTYQIDYHGLAGIIHSLLFGKYIDTIADKTAGVGAGASKKYRLKEGFKRYWQGEIWSELFDLLLNPTTHVEGWDVGGKEVRREEGGKMPVLNGLKAVRERMELWVESNCERGLGLQAGIRRLEYLLSQRK